MYFSIFVLTQFSKESYISFSSFSIRNNCPLCHRHRCHTNFLFFLQSFSWQLYVHFDSWGWQKYLWSPTCLSSPIAWYPVFYLFTSPNETLLLNLGVSWSNLPFLVPSSATSHNSGLSPKADLCIETSWEDTGAGQGNQKAELTLTFQTSGKLRPRRGLFCQA